VQKVIDLLREKDEQIFKLENRIKECENGYEGTLHLERCKLHDAEIKIAQKDAEIESLKNLLDDKCDRCIARDKAEAITQIAERLITYFDALKSGLVSYHIKQIAKEMREKLT
jgi:hypothetical protein